MTMTGDIPVTELIREFWVYSIHGRREDQEARGHTPENSLQILVCLFRLAIGLGVENGGHNTTVVISKSSVEIGKPKKPL